MNILFLTTNNLATNPRLYKELNLALEQGYSCTLVQFKLGNWSDEKTKTLLEGKEVNVVQLDATSSHRFNWIKWGVLEKVAKMIYPFFKNQLWVNALASSRRSFQILNANINPFPDLICAHNLGALYPAWSLSKEFDIPFIFDVEDYHPGEFIRFDAFKEKGRREFLMKALLPKANALTTASPLIERQTLRLIDGHANNRVVLNGFPKSEFSGQDFMDQDGVLKIVWFSQKISFGRGLEQFFTAISQMDEKRRGLIEVSLIGDLDPQFKQEILVPIKNQGGIKLNVIPAISQQDLHFELSNFDLGLAIEPGKDLNNNLAISNKIIAYAQAGLYILATDTPAQRVFIEENSSLGTGSAQSTSGLLEKLIFICDNLNQIKQDKQKRKVLGEGLSWEVQCDKVLQLWDKVVANKGVVVN